MIVKVDAADIKSEESFSNNVGICAITLLVKKLSWHVLELNH